MYQLAKFAMVRAASKSDAAAAWAKAVVAAGGSVSTGRQELVSSLIANLKTDGLWTKLDRLWIFAGENTQSALIDLKAFDQATTVNSPTFSADRGYAGNGTSSYVNTTFNPSTQGVAFTTADASWFLWDRTHRAGANNHAGFVNGTGGNAINVRHTDDQAYFVCNQSTATGVAGRTTSSGFFNASRASGSVNKYIDGTSVGSDSLAAQTVANEEAYVCASKTVGGAAGNFNSDVISLAGFGASVDATQAAALYTRLRDYLASINTVLLLHGDGADASTTITDSSARHTVTAVGNAQVDTAQSKFGGASILFDGAGDYLTLDGSPDFAFGTGDFSVDFWVRLAATGAQRTLYDGRTAVDGGANLQFVLYVNSSNLLRMFSAGSDRISGTTALSANTWYHVALARQGTSTKLFLSGTQEGSTYSDSTNYAVVSPAPYMGAAYDASSALSGWLEEVRVVKGFAAWTANFTPPTAPYTVGAYEPDYAPSVLLLHGNGTDASTTITDSSASAHTVTVNGNAQIDTAQSVFGGASILLDGTGDYLSLDGSSNFAFGTGDFTFDMRVRFNSFPGGNQHLIDLRSGGFAIYMAGGFNELRFYFGADRIVGGSLSTGIWYHVAAVRVSGVTKMFLNGSQIGSNYIDTNNYTITASKPNIGADDAGTSGFVNGWVEEIRAIKGIGIWTDNFAVPISAYSR